jgi:glycosyltransferase involved in cell wall biosynthesis
MDISTCIITYNQKAYIEKAILGALSQQFSKDTLYEIIISDDCSDDGTSEICRDYAGRFQNIRYIGLTSRISGKH